MSGQQCWPADPECTYYSRGVRKTLFAQHPTNATKILEHTDQTLASSTVYITSERFDKDSFAELMHTSEFCLAAPGYAVWSPRPIEAIMAGCIPAVLAEGYIPPFADVLDWKRLAVFLKHEDAGHIVASLAGVQPAHRRSLRRAIARAQPIMRVSFDRYRAGEDAVDLVAFQLWRRFVYKGTAGNDAVPAVA